MREKIDQILSKESIEDADIKVLVRNMNLLTESEKVRLGFIPAPVVEGPVKVVEPEAVAVAPKAKRASKKK
jgi:hypothetical protein